jgi:photosystem II stability/assembly factor-like uncharacterized protein
MAWSLAPLTNRGELADGADSDDAEVELARALHALADLETERVRGAVSEAEHDQLETELRRDAARVLKAHENRRQRIDGLVEAWLSGAEQRPVADGDQREESRSARTRPGRARVVWVLVPVVLVGILATVVAVFTLGARATAGTQTVVGQVAVSSIAGLAASSSDPETLVVGHAAGLQRSVDGGVSWRAVELAQSVRGMAGTAQGLFAVTDDAVFVSRDGGSSWTRLAAAPELQALAAGRRSGRLIGLLPDGRLTESSNAGTTWHILPNQPLPGATSLAVIDEPVAQILVGTPREGLLATGGSEAWRSANGFVNGALPTVSVRAVWYEPDSGDEFASPTGARFRGAIYLATDAGLFKSADGAQSWTRLGLRADVVAIAGSAADPRSLFAIARDGSVFRSRDSGATWR